MTSQQDRPGIPAPADGPEGTAAPALPTPPDRGLDQPPQDLPGQPDRRPVDQRAGSVAEQLRERLWRLPPGHPSSPYDSNGALRPPVPDYRQLERPLPGEVQYNAPKPNPGESPGWPADSRQGSADKQDAPYAPDDGAPESGGRGIDSWGMTVTRLKEAWQTHEEEWPAAQRPSADRSHDEPGSWRGDSGRYLNAEENLVSDHALQRIGDVEKKTTPALLEIKTQVPGADLVGLQHKLKGEDRFKEKVSEESRAKPERSIGEIAERIPDALRYTCQIDTALYVHSYWRARDLLQQRGNELLLSRNSWDDPEYRGVNTRWLSPQGQVFEVQFHTPESHEAKELTHKAYERLRSKVTGHDERPLLEAFQREVSAQIPLPPGVNNIPDYRKEGY